MNRWYTVSVLMSFVVIVALIGLNMMESEKNNDHIMHMKLEFEDLKIEQGTIEHLVDLVEQYQNQLIKAQKENTRLRELLDAFKIETFEATAYTHVKTTGVADINGTGDGITKSGLKVREGLIAVDPSVIPLGSKVWVEGFGVLTAADTGGAIKGNRIDIFMNSRSEAFKWGRQDIKVVVYQNITSKTL